MDNLEPLFYITLFELTLKKNDPKAYAEVRAQLSPDCDYFSPDPKVKQAWAESELGAAYLLLLREAVQTQRENEKAAEQGLKVTLTRKPRGRLSGLAERLTAA